MYRRVAAVAVLFLSASVLIAQTPTILVGRLVGNDGRPMKAARVSVVGKDGEYANAASDGRFRLAVTPRGLVRLEFSGVDHAPLVRGLLLETTGDTITMDVRLSTLQHVRTFDSLRVVGDFNNWRRSDAIPLTRADNGVYIATIPLSKSDKATAYQIQGLVPGRTVNGTDGASYQYDGGGDWKTVIPVKKGKAVVVFDPTLLVEGDEGPMAAVADEFQAEVIDLMLRLEYSRAMAASTSGEAHGSDSEQEWAARLLPPTQAMAMAPTLPIRRLYALEYLALSSTSPLPPDSSRTSMAMHILGPETVTWEIDPGAIPSAVFRSGGVGPHAQFLDRFLASRVAIGARANAAYGIASGSLRRGDTLNFLKYYARLASDFAETSAGRMALARLNPDRRVQPGRPVPQFALASLTDADSAYTPQSFEGKIYLIDFWATWCGPCIAEMPNLHKAYDRFHKRGFEILSLSFDRSPTDIDPFRRGTWAMPWHHAFVVGGFKSELARNFEVIGIPKPILVDASGVVIATEEALRGDQLMTTLEKLFPDTQ